MFNNYTQALAGLFRVKEVPRRYSEILMSVLGRCDGELDFRGDLTVDNLTVRNSFSGAGAANSYAVATATWVRASGHSSYVTCRAASSPTGTLTSDATTFTVYLPRSVAHKDPNVYAGDVLQYVEIGGIKYAIGESYLDDKIGTLRAMTFNSAHNGWARCDGTGSTVDHTNKFVRGSSSYAATGGADSHTHTGSITTDNASVSITGSTGSQALATSAAGGTTGSSTTGITLDAHPDHRHVVPNPCQVQSGTPYPISTSSIIYTEGMIEIAGTGGVTYTHNDLMDDPGHTHSVGSHTHAITPDPHSHTAGTLAGSSHNHTGSVSINSADNIPAYLTVVWYVRVGPSGEIT